jgi:hypothetical protein
MDAFLLNWRPFDVAPVVSANGFRLSAMVAELFLVLIDEEFGVLFNCSSKSQQFASQTVMPPIPLVADKEMPTAALILILVRMEEVNELIADGRT